ERPQLRLDDAAATIDDDREWQRGQIVAERFRQFDRAVAADQRRIIEPQVARERLHFRRIVDGDANELQALRAIARLRRDELRHFLATRRTPRRPEVDD